MEQELTLHTNRFLVACDNLHSTQDNISLFFYGYIREQENHHEHKLYDNFPMDIIKYLKMFSYEFEENIDDCSDRWQDSSDIKLENDGKKAIINNFQALIANKNNYDRFILKTCKTLRKNEERRVWNVKVSAKTESLTFDIGMGYVKGITAVNDSKFCIKSGSTINKQIKVNNNDIVNILYIGGRMKFGVNYSKEWVQTVDNVKNIYHYYCAGLKVTIYHDIDIELL